MARLVMEFMEGRFRTPPHCRARWCATISPAPMTTTISRGNRHFLWDRNQSRVGNVNLLTTFPDKAHMRNLLSYGTYRDAGAPYHYVVPVRVQTNGGFYGDWHIVENGDKDFLKRIGRDPDGA